MIGKEAGHYLAFSKKWPKSRRLMERFDKEMVKLKDDGELKKIYDKWGVIDSLGK